MADLLDLGPVPFYWRTKSSALQAPQDVPARLPFAFSYREDLQLVIQKRNPDVLNWLARVYAEASNVGYLQEGHALAQSYGGEFIEFFERASRLLPATPATAADIGCGGIYLLQQLRQKGLSVKGIDPSPVTLASGRDAGIEIVPDFYPTPSFTERVDVLIHYDVLEHVEDPVAFLRAHHGNLSGRGGIVFAVPDCTHHIRLGDASMMLHEHLNYFDHLSLAHVVRSAGFEPLLLQPARHGGVLLCCAVAVQGGRSNAPAPPVQPGRGRFESFRARVQASRLAFEHFARQALGGELGLYVPLRSFPYLASIDPRQRLRFFDDDAGLHHRYFDGFDVPVENFSDLLAQPPKHLVICSLVFGDRIAQKARARLPSVVRLMRWVDLFDQSGRQHDGD